MIGKLSEEEMNKVLQSNLLGRLGCTDGERVYVVPINYVYDGKYIIGHSTVGMKINMMRKNPGVCFEVDDIKSLSNWKSVISWGQFEELTDELESYNAMQLFVDRMLHLKISETAVPPEIAEKRVHPRAPGNINPVVFRILLTEKTGRFEKDE